MGFFKSVVLSVTGTGVLLLALSGCEQASTELSMLSQKQVAHLIPSRVSERTLWAEDILQVFKEQKIRANRQNICSAIAVIDQESNFNADPAVPNLGKTAIRALKEKLDDKFGPYVTAQFMEMLSQKPAPDDSFAIRLKTVKTERQLDELYREMFDYFKSQYHLSLVTGAASIFSGKSVGESLNPVKTLGSMQVHINYAVNHPKDILPVERLRDYVYTREGGLYYGIGRLLNYEAAYKQPVYRFADYNSGIYSSRNSSVQDWVNKLLKYYKIDQQPIPEDGDLLLYDKSESPRSEISNSEAAIQKIFEKAGSDLGTGQIHRDLKLEKNRKFEETRTYAALKQLYEEKTGKKAAYAQIPQVTISGPKLSRDYNSSWYANKVNARYQSCMKR